MKILLIHNYGQFRGGAETYFESLCSELEKKGHKVIKYIKDYKTINSFFDKIKISIGLFYNTRTDKELRKLIEQEKPEVAQIMNIYPLISAQVYKVLKKYKIPVIQRIQDYRFFCPKATLFRKKKICELCVTKKLKYPSFIYGCYQNSKLASLIFSFAFYFHQIIGSYKLIDRYIFPTKFVRDYYIKYARIKKQKTIVISTFTDISQFKNNKRTKIKEKDFFLYFGRLSEEKGIIQLLDIFKTLRDIKLVVVGDGPLKNKVVEYKKYSNILIKGQLPREEIVTYIERALITIIPSIWYDVLPNVLIESYACGRPVLVPNTGFFPSLVKNKKTGLIYKDFSDLKLKIIRLSNNIGLINNMSMQAKEENEIKYLPKIHYSKLISVYKKFLNV